MSALISAPRLTLVCGHLNFNKLKLDVQSCRCSKIEMYCQCKKNFSRILYRLTLRDTTIQTLFNRSSAMCFVANISDHSKESTLCMTYL